MRRTASISSNGSRGERLGHLEIAVVADDHEAIALPYAVLHEALQAVEDPAPVGGRDVEVVDVDHQVQLLLRRPLVFSRLGRARLGQRQPALGVAQDAVVVDRGVEVGDLDRLAVLENLEVGYGQVVDRPALLVGHEDLDVDHVDVDRVDEGIVPASS